MLPQEIEILNKYSSDIIRFHEGHQVITTSQMWSELLPIVRKYNPGTSIHPGCGYCSNQLLRFSYILLNRINNE